MNVTQARDILFNLVSTNFPHYIAWDDLPASKPETTWARATVTHVSGGQVSLASDVGARRFNRSGFVKVQIFTVLGAGMVEGYGLAETLLTGFEVFRGDVWLRNIRLNEAGSNGAFSQINVLADFYYDDVK
jgi:hypothetical protein